MRIEATRVRTKPYMTTASTGQRTLPGFIMCGIREFLSITEFEMESDVKRIVSKTKELVVCSFPTRDLDRLLSFAIKECSLGKSIFT